MKKLLCMIILISLLLSGCISNEKENALKGADFIEGDAVLCEIEPYTIIFGSNKRSSTSSNMYGQLFDYTQLKDSDVNQTKEFSFKNEKYVLNYLFTNFVNTILEYGVIDYYYNEEKNMLFGFKRDNDMLVVFRRLTTDSKPENSPLNKVELETIIDQKMYDLSGQTGYKKMVRERKDFPGEGNYMGIYTLMLGDFATQKKIIVTVDAYGQLLDYRWCSDFYGDLSVIDINTIDFTKIENNTKLKLTEENAGYNLDNFEFKDKNLYYLSDGSLCVEYFVSYNKTDEVGKSEEVIKEAFTIIEHKRNGSPNKNIKFKLKPDNLYRIIDNMLLSDIELGDQLKNGNLDYLNNSLYIRSTRGIPYKKQNMQPKIIMIDGKEIEVPYSNTLGYVDNNFEFIKSDSYDLETDDEIDRLFIDFIDGIERIYLQYNDKVLTLEELRLKAEKIIEDNFDIVDFKYEYEVASPELSIITYSKMLGDFCTTTVKATLKLGSAIIIEFISPEWDIKVLDVDLEEVKNKIVDQIKERNDKAPNLVFNKMFLEQVYETNYIKFWVSYDAPSQSPDKETYRKGEVFYYIY